MVTVPSRNDRNEALMFLIPAIAVAIALAILAGTAGAQGRGHKAGTIPPGHMPPPGLCRVWSDVPGMDGMEVLLKGGQMGQADFFGRVLHGTA